MDLDETEIIFPAQSEKLKIVRMIEVDGTKSGSKLKKYIMEDKKEYTLLPFFKVDIEIKHINDLSGAKPRLFGKSEIALKQPVATKYYEESLKQEAAREKKEAKAKLKEGK